MLLCTGTFFMIKILNFLLAGVTFDRREAKLKSMGNFRCRLPTITHFTEVRSVVSKLEHEDGRLPVGVYFAHFV
jgi:hypothetical protein